MDRQKEHAHMHLVRPGSPTAGRAHRSQRSSLQRVQAHGSVQAGRNEPLGAHSQAGDHRRCTPAFERLPEQALGCTQRSWRLTRWLGQH